MVPHVPQRTSGSPPEAARPPETATLLEEFAEVIAHELKTPLAIVLGAAETVLSHDAEDTTDELREMLQMIHRNAELATLLLGRSASRGTSRPARSSSPSTRSTWAGSSPSRSPTWAT